VTREQKEQGKGHGESGDMSNGDKKKERKGLRTRSTFRKSKKKPGSAGGKEGKPERGQTRIKIATQAGIGCQKSKTP